MKIHWKLKLYWIKENLTKKIKCYLGLHSWKEDVYTLNKYCGNCGKIKTIK